MERDGPPGNRDTCYVRMGGYLAQFRQAGSWDDLWLAFSDQQVRRVLHHKGTLGSHKGFFRPRLPEQGVILEAGCGLGTWVSRLLRRGYTCIGVDLAVKTLQRSKALAAHLPLLAGDIFHLPLGDNSLSAYLSFGVMEHFIEGPGNALREAYRVLKPGGLALVSVPYENAYREGVETREAESARQAGLEFYQYYFKPRAFLNELAKVGFIPEYQEIHYFGVYTGIQEQIPTLGIILTRLPYGSIWALVLDKLPWLTKKAGHMIFTSARKPD